MNKYNPIPFRSPNKIEHIYEETVEDVNGNKAIIKYCDYIDKNNKLITKYQLQVKWIEEPEEMDKKELDSFLKSYCSILDNCMLIYYDWYLCYHFIYKNELYFATIENNFRTYFIFKLKIINL